MNILKVLAVVVIGLSSAVSIQAVAGQQLPYPAIKESQLRQKAHKDYKQILEEHAQDFGIWFVPSQADRHTSFYRGAAYLALRALDDSCLAAVLQEVAQNGSMIWPDSVFGVESDGTVHIDISADTNAIGRFLKGIRWECAPN